MHQSSFNIMGRFRNLAIKHFPEKKISLLDIGSYGVNGSYKEIFSTEERFSYTGLDLQPGPNVDYVPKNPYVWPELADESYDVIISGQAFEHIEFPWLIMDEISRVLRKNGLCCIVAPSRGPEHKFPVDCWRYYPDGLRALAKWAGLEVLEAKACWGASGFKDGSDQWGDAFCILYKSEQTKSIDKARRKLRDYRAFSKNNPLKSEKAAAYYSIARSEVIDSLKKNGIPTKRILEIGCGTGATAQSIREVFGVDFYVGVEISEAAAEIAAKSLDKIIIADIEAADLTYYGIQKSDFDLVLALDVLEHLKNPWDAVAYLTEFMKPGGTVVASIPNVQNITVLNDLAGGKWTYQDAGILDATHLRFFTYEGIRNLFGGADLRLTKMESILNPRIDVSALKESGNTLNHGKMSLCDLSRQEVIQLFTYQYLVIGQKELVGTEKEGRLSDADAASLMMGKAIHGSEIPETPCLPLNRRKGLVSIIILTFNQLEYTKKCVRSIRKNTPEPHEIIFIDNGSSDGTVKWLRKVTAENPHYRMIENGVNLGFAKGCNQGIEESSGEFILLLNNDVIVTVEWLEGMLECLKGSPENGIVGPMTDNISGPQRVVIKDCLSLDFLETYAKLFRERNRSRHIPLRRIVGFCMLFRYELVEKVGLLDESFGIGNFEDDDFSLRAALEGYTNVIAGDVFIHHYGSVSFNGNTMDYSASLGKNRKLFDDKWRNIDASSRLGRRIAVMNATEKANELRLSQRLEEAIGALVEGIKYDPENKSLYYKLASMLIDSKKFGNALEALESMPGVRDLKWHALAGYCREGSGQHSEAESEAEHVLSLKPDYAPALNLKGALAFKKGLHEEAEKFFKLAVGAEPGYGEPYTNLGVLKWSLERYKEGLELLEKGFVLSPDVPDIASLYHAAVIETKEFAKAENRFSEAKALFPMSRQLRFLLIDLLIRQDKNEAALSEIEDAMVIFEIDEGIITAALEIRKRAGIHDIMPGPKKGTLSVCMIVRDEEKHLAKCLHSLRSIADEIIVVDTGSADSTRDIAAVFGARVYELPWRGDFSEARNYSLSKASGEWILVMDGDEVLSPRDYPALKEITSAKKSGPPAYEIATRNYVKNVGDLGWTANTGDYPGEEKGSGWFPSVKVRLFSNDARIRFEGHVHETVERSIIAIGTEIRRSGIIVHHYGKMDREKVIEKGENYYQLGRKKLQQNGDDVKSLFELATQAQELRKYDEAIELWQRAIALSEKPVAVFFFNLGYVFLQTGKYHEAREASKKAMDIDPNMREAALNYCYCELLVGDYLKIFEVFKPADSSDYPPALLLMAVAYCISGEKKKAEDLLSMFRIKRFMAADAVVVLCGKMIEVGRQAQSLVVLEMFAASGQGSSEINTLLNECRGLLHEGAFDEKEMKVR